MTLTPPSLDIQRFPPPNISSILSIATEANFGPLQRPYSEDISPVIRHFQSKSSQFGARVGEADEASSRNSHCSSYLACGERLNRNRLPKGEETWGNRRL